MRALIQEDHALIHLCRSLIEFVHTLIKLNHALIELVSALIDLNPAIIMFDLLCASIELVHGLIVRGLIELVLALNNISY